jgi:hypothetical protein
MPQVGEYVRKRVLITARTYPAPARQGVEVSCTGGITDGCEWIRLFPIPYRFLSPDRRFRKYQWIDVRAVKSSDPRPESYRIDIDSIKILGNPLPSADFWRARKEVVFPLLAPSLCYLQRTRQQTGATVGVFKPREISGFDITPERNSDWTPAERERLSQQGLFETEPLVPLEKIPYKFHYRFKCDDMDCGGHRLSCVDWELGQAYRKWRQDYGDQRESALREKFERQIIERFNTHFFVGTIKAHPHVWIIVGLFYPLKNRQPALDI